MTRVVSVQIERPETQPVRTVKVQIKPCELPPVQVVRVVIVDDRKHR
jgi:hypothetical protein